MSMPKQAIANYEEYLQRMTQSANESSKCLIPMYLNGRKNILDVGCADGILIEKILELNPNSNVIGIDICEKSVQLCKNKGLEAYITDIEHFDWHNKFDAIVFSSVMHEISSYYVPEDESDYNERFSSGPIEQALQYAYDLLEDNGIILIRDGIAGDTNDYIHFQFKNKEDIKWLKMFANTDVCQYINSCMYKNPFSKLSDVICTDGRVFRELMMKYTWGEQSWERESQELVGILTYDEWLNIVSRTKFVPIMITTSSEKYYEYLKDKISCYNLWEKFANSTITMILKKQDV